MLLSSFVCGINKLTHVSEHSQGVFLSCLEKARLRMTPAWEGNFFSHQLTLAFILPGI